jgi:hypothetical protein
VVVNYATGRLGVSVVYATEEPQFVEFYEKISSGGVAFQDSKRHQAKSQHGRWLRFRGALPVCDFETARTFNPSYEQSREADI